MGKLSVNWDTEKGMLFFALFCPKIYQSMKQWLKMKLADIVTQLNILVASSSSKCEWKWDVPIFLDFACPIGIRNTSYFYCSKKIFWLIDEALICIPVSVYKFIVVQLRKKMDHSLRAGNSFLYFFPQTYSKGTCLRNILYLLLTASLLLPGGCLSSQLFSLFKAPPLAAQSFTA